jgi:alkylhydroperoxidase/carboxymuconolactone decarboxylase family protein YurZ
MVLLIGLATTSAARWQQSATKTPPAGPKASARDSVERPSPELKKSLDDLAAAVQALASRIASDPQIKTAALHVATSAVTTAQQVVREQSVVIEGALKTAADRISGSQLSPHQPSKR